MDETRTRSEYVGRDLAYKLFCLYGDFHEVYGLTHLAAKYLDDYYPPGVMDLDHKLEGLLYETAVETNS